MEAIVVSSKLSKKELYRINMYLLYRKKIMWFFAILAIVMFIGMLAVNNDPDDNTPQWFGGFFLIFYTSLPFAMYWGVHKNYEKIKAMSELKIYHLDEDTIKLDGQTMNMTIDWSHIERVYERKNDLLAITSNGRGVHYLPKSGFESVESIQELKDIIKSKKIKNNIKS